MQGSSRAGMSSCIGRCMCKTESTHTRANGSSVASCGGLLGVWWEGGEWKQARLLPLILED